MRPNSPFPLTFPAGWERTPAARREPSRFATGFVRTRTLLLDEIRKMGGSDVLISSNLPVRRDGMPYAAGSVRRDGGRDVDDPGVAVYWRGEQREDRAMACDRWLKPSDNLQAIALSIKALRGLDRWGSSSMVQKAFAGFAALPPGPVDQPPPEPPVEIVWRTILRVDLDDDLDIARAKYRKLARELHPDAGGSHVAMQRLNAAFEIAERELR